MKLGTLCLCPKFVSEYLSRQIKEGNITRFSGVHKVNEPISQKKHRFLLRPVRNSSHDFFINASLVSLDLS